jgi:hypothetical protein
MSEGGYPLIPKSKSDYCFWRALNVPDPTSESRRDGVKVAQDISPGYTLDQNQNSPAGTAERCVRSIQPSLAGLDSFVNPTPHFVRGYFHAVPSGLLRAPGAVSGLTADGPRLYQRQRLTGKQLETVFGQSCGGAACSWSFSFSITSKHRYARRREEGALSFTA